MRTLGRIRSAGAAALLLLCLAAALPASGAARGECRAAPSRILGRSVPYCVLLPPSYDADKTRRFPILYFLHGLGDNEQMFLHSGGWDLVQDLWERQRLGDYLAANVWQPLGMKDATFHLTEAQRPRLARAFPNDPLTGKPQSINLLDTPTKFDCGGACAFATVGDYLRFGQMLLNGGELDGQRVLGPKTVHHMISNHLGPEIKNNVANVEPHRGGFGFGLGVAVRTSEGLSSVPGNPGEFTWNGAYGTQFFCDPKERLVVVVGTAAPGELRKYYREQIQDIVYGAMVR